MLDTNVVSLPVSSSSQPGQRALCVPVSSLEAAAWEQSAFSIGRAAGLRASAYLVSLQHLILREARVCL